MYGGKDERCKARGGGDQSMKTYQSVKKAIERRMTSQLSNVALGLPAVEKARLRRLCALLLTDVVVEPSFPY